jgi:hypothetical protein
MREMLASEAMDALMRVEFVFEGRGGGEGGAEGAPTWNLWKGCMRAMVASEAMDALVSSIVEGVLYNIY